MHLCPVGAAHHAVQGCQALHRAAGHVPHQRLLSVRPWLELVDVAVVENIMFSKTDNNNNRNQNSHPQCRGESVEERV